MYKKHLLRLLACQKYGKQIYLKFQSIFNLLPLCTVIGNSVIVLHGGLFRHDNLLLEDIKGVGRKKSCPTNPETLEVV